jgi:hypothetical protein
MKILFVGDCWMGSSARSLREALVILPDVDMDEIGEDLYVPHYRSLPLRVANRVLWPLQHREIVAEIDAKITAFKPDVLMVYKGSSVGAEVIQRAKRAGVFTVNIFPDVSPHAYGSKLRKAMGEYDLVISTKPFHPAGWSPIYGYRNRCVCVPHGYDPAVHFWPEPPQNQDFDIVLAATWRAQYHSLMQELASKLNDERLRIGIIGGGWRDHAAELPAGWVLADPLQGRSYGEWLRCGRIAIAPVHTDVSIRGVQQPGDEDTTRTYELAAAGCFFLHRRTEYVQSIYDEGAEVPMWSNASELAALVRKYLPLEEVRRSMAARAHLRAVPAYSIPKRAEQLLDHVRMALLAMDGDF